MGTYETNLDPETERKYKAAFNTITEEAMRDHNLQRKDDEGDPLPRTHCVFVDYVWECLEAIMRGDINGNLMTMLKFGGDAEKTAFFIEHQTRHRFAEAMMAMGRLQDRGQMDEMKPANSDQYGKPLRDEQDDGESIPDEIANPYNFDAAPFKMSGASSMADDLDTFLKALDHEADDILPPKPSEKGGETDDFI